MDRRPWATRRKPTEDLPILNMRIPRISITSSSLKLAPLVTVNPLYDILGDVILNRVAPNQDHHQAVGFLNVFLPNVSHRLGSLAQRPRFTLGQASRHDYEPSPAPKACQRAINTRTARVIRRRCTYAYLLAVAFELRRLDMLSPCNKDNFRDF